MEKQGLNSNQPQKKKDRSAYMFNRKWVAVGVECLDFMLGLKSLVQLKVMSFIMGNMETGNRFFMSHTEIADKLGISRPQVSRAIKALIAEGVIEPIGKSGLGNVYSLHPALAYRGSARRQNEALRIASDRSVIRVKERMNKARIKGVIDGGKE